MSEGERAPSAIGTNLPLLAFLVLFEGSLAALLLALYKRAGAPWPEFLQRPAGVVLVLAGIGILLPGSLIIREYRRHRPSPRSFHFTLVLNLLTVALAFLAAESLVRVFAVTTPDGVTVRGRALVPQHSWERFAARELALIRRFAPGGVWSSSYLVPDDSLGWTVGPGRQSKDGLYLSSEEGVRSASRGVKLGGPTTRTRIALLGDSYTFGREVSFEDTWAHRLELGMGPDYQVLNFGVDGYGVDQAYLRYERDVRPWKPAIVVLSVIEHDCYRTLTVYPAVSFPVWTVPFSKPRFVLQDGALIMLNTPVPGPETVFRTPRIEDLPLLDYEAGYDPALWHERFYHASYFVRFLLTAFPRSIHLKSGPCGSDARVALNTALIREFGREVRKAGSLPLVVYLPSKTDFFSPAGREETLGILKASGVPSVDLTSCVAEVDPSRRFLKFHYTPLANQAVGRCMEDAIRSAMRASGLAALNDQLRLSG